jgi:30S ribosomal protein S31
MGKGDRKTAKGKRFAASHGNARGKGKPVKAAAVKKVAAAPKAPVAKKAVAKKAAAK